MAGMQDMAQGAPAGAPAGAPSDGGSQDQGGKSGADALMEIIQTVDQGLGIITDAMTKLPIPDDMKKQVVGLQDQFRSVMQSVVGGGEAEATDAGEQEPKPNQMSQMGGANGVPANQNYRS